MVTLPKDFVATRYPGYFWNVAEKKLYSIKVSGELRELKFSKGGDLGWVKIPPGYKISVKGTRRYYTLDYLNKLTATTEIQEIGIAK